MTRFHHPTWGRNRSRSLRVERNPKQHGSRWPVAILRSCSGCDAGNHRQGAAPRDAQVRDLAALGWLGRSRWRKHLNSSGIDIRRFKLYRFLRQEHEISEQKKQSKDDTNNTATRFVLELLRKHSKFSDRDREGGDGEGWGKRENQ
jgi:hypothetical protein